MTRILNLVLICLLVASAIGVYSIKYEATLQAEKVAKLRRSIEAGTPQAIDAVRTIADSLGAPRCEPYSFALNARFLDGVVLVDDDQIREAMRLLFRAAKLVVEPAGAAALAALMFPLRSRLEGKRVAVVVCGGNIDATTFARELLAASDAGSGKSSQ